MKQNLSVGDGWRFGTGFGLAMLIAVPLLMTIFGCGALVVITTIAPGLLGG